MKLLCFGSRNYSNREKIRNKIFEIKPSIVIHGNANGADRLAAEIALNLEIEVMSFPANWSKFGRAAGPIRNQQMLDEGKPDRAIGFSDDWENSKGSNDMYKRCIKAGIPVEKL